jgi:hypothetical protein
MGIKKVFPLVSFFFESNLQILPKDKTLKLNLDNFPDIPFISHLWQVKNFIGWMPGMKWREM